MTGVGGGGGGPPGLLDLYVLYTHFHPTPSPLLSRIAAAYDADLAQVSFFLSFQDTLVYGDAMYAYAYNSVKLSRKHFYGVVAICSGRMELEILILHSLRQKSIGNRLISLRHGSLKK